MTEERYMATGTPADPECGEALLSSVYNNMNSHFAAFPVTYVGVNV